MRAVQNILNDMQLYLEERKKKGLNEDYDARRAHFQVLTALISAKKYNEVKNHIELGITTFTKFSFFKQNYLGYLQQLKANLYAPSREEKKIIQTRLYSAINNHNIAEVKETLSEGGLAVINDKFDDDRTPLQLALQKKDRVLIETIITEVFAGGGLSALLQQANAVPGHRSTDVNNPIIIVPGTTLLHFVVSFGLTPILNELLKKNVDINVVDHYGQTPLFLACFSGNEQAVNLLLKQGASTKVSDEIYAKLGSPLAAAVSSGNRGIVNNLLMAGAQVDKVALEYAKEKRDLNPEIYDILKYPFKIQKLSVILMAKQSEKWLDAHESEVPEHLKNLIKHIYFERGVAADFILDELLHLHQTSPNLRPIIDLLALAATGHHGKLATAPKKPLKIIVNSDANIARFMAGCEQGLGAYNAKNTIYLGSAMQNYVLAILMHEGKHFCDNVIFGTSAIGFPSILQSEFDKIFTSIQENVEQIKRNNPNGISRILALSIEAVFSKGYLNKAQAVELLARVPEALGALGDEKGSQWLEENLAPLFNFYKKYYLPVCEKYINDRYPDRAPSSNVSTPG